jgi:hypothetical protein
MPPLARLVLLMSLLQLGWLLAQLLSLLQELLLSLLQREWPLAQVLSLMQGPLLQVLLPKAWQTLPQVQASTSRPP